MGRTDAVLRWCEPAPTGQAPANTIDVPSCDDFIVRIEKAGGKVSVPRMVIPGVGWLAYCVDPQGNSFGIMQADSRAA